MSEILQALYRGDQEKARALAAAAASLDIFETAALGDAHRLSLLLARDAGLARAFAADGFTALHLASFFGHAAAVDALLKAGAEPNAVSRNEMRVQPLHSAAVTGQPKVILSLLDAGADPNGRQAGGFTPLQARALRGDVENCRVLLERGADLELKADDGRTALEIARAQGHSSLVALFEARTQAPR